MIRRSFIGRAIGGALGLIGFSGLKPQSSTVCSLPLSAFDGKYPLYPSKQPTDTIWLGYSEWRRRPHFAHLPSGQKGPSVLPNELLKPDDLSTAFRAHFHKEHIWRVEADVITEDGEQLCRFTYCFDKSSKSS